MIIDYRLPETENRLQSVFEELYQLLQERKNACPESSYVAALHTKGIDAILKKIGEESSEVILAAKNNSSAETLYEIADLWFHTLVLMSHMNITPEQIAAELQRRSGTSGIAEKKSRLSIDISGDAH